MPGPQSQFRECLAARTDCFTPHRLNAALARVDCEEDSDRSNLRELVILSTCNRVELYAVTIGSSFDQLEAFLAEVQDLPLTTLAPWSELQKNIDQVLAEAAGRPGHIFNLGHGLHKTTPVDNVSRLVDYAHEKTNC